MPTIRVRDINMYYELHGKGMPLVHVGGLAGDARAGRTDCPDMAYSTRLFAEDTLGLMDALGIETAHLYGISMGGCIVQEAAIAKLDRYGKRICENLINVYKAQGAAEAARHMTLFCYTPAYFNTHKEEIDAKERTIGDAKRPGHAFLHSAMACIEHDSRARLPALRIPALVNCGDQDPWCSPECSREIAALIPGAKLRLYPDSSHFFLNEHFDVCMPEILAFLRSVS